MFESKSKINLWTECGDEYYYGENGEQIDYEMAVIFYERAAKKKHPHATYMLGLCYELGRGVAKNNAYADELYKKAARYGDRDAIKRFAAGKPLDDDNESVSGSAQEALRQAKSCYQQGAFEKVLKLLEEASDLPEAQFMLGVMYANGDGLPADARAAFHFYEKAAQAGLADAQYNLGLLYYNGDGVRLNRKKALYWYENAALQGDSLAQHDTANMYYNGIGTAIDLDKAFEWFEKSAMQGDTEAQFSLAKLYENGEGINQNNKQAVEWMTKAAEHGHTAAQVSLGLYYGAGGIAEEDFDRSFYWYDKAALAGDADSMEQIGNYRVTYENGSRLQSTLRSLAGCGPVTLEALKEKIKERMAAQNNDFDALALSFLFIKIGRGADSLYDEDVVRAYLADLLPTLPTLRKLASILYVTGAIDCLNSEKPDTAGAVKRLSVAGMGLYEAETLIRCLSDAENHKPVEKEISP